ncbi:CW-type zinc-finger protein [Quillaja saponaria]|uniref:CW-type zinc-finger protein n=1 Tax=Quillaja saponaria TaxID=32244 RepID=A0AAD7VLP5_QUISA|nr:CW-type zinc-finger protein [Quillaja saponaria]
MEDNTELEEGEACYYKDDDERIDPDIALSYIDEKIQHVLGHFQKDFEGGVSAENLGAKFGGYGSFLPTYERSTSIWSRPKTPQRNPSTPRSPSNLSAEAASHDLKAPPNAPPSVKLGFSSHSAHSLHDTKVSSSDDSVKQDISAPSNLVAEKCPLKDDNTNGLGNFTDRSRLKVRLKVKSNNIAQKNAAIYSGLGLEDSPSSSLGNSLEESGGAPPVSQASPTSIIQAMTSLPIPGGVLISPLHDNLLYLIRKEYIRTDSNSMSSINGHQELRAMYETELPDRKLSKEKKVRLKGKSEKGLAVKHMNGVDIENDMTLQTKKSLLNKSLEGKDFFPSDLKCTPPLSSVGHIGKPADLIGRASDVSNGPNKDGVNGRLFPSESMKEASAESISDQDCGKSEKQHLGSSFVEKVSEHRVANSHIDKNSINLRNSGRRKPYTFSTSVKAKPDVIKYKEDPDPLEQKTKLKEKSSFGGKNKSKGDHSASKPLAITTKERFKADVGTVAKDKNSGDGVTPSKSKMHKIKSLKDNKVGVHRRDSVKENNLEWTDTGMDLVDGSIINGNIDNIEERSAERVNVKERLSGDKISNQLISRLHVTDASNTCLFAENKLSEIVPAAPASVVIAEDWVGCDSCHKWRLLPFGTKPEHLPDKWLCSMLNWLPGMNRCDISEKETTKALYGLYQIPVPESPTNLQNHATGTALGVSSADVPHKDQKHQNATYHEISNGGKKKCGSKETAKARRDNDRNHMQEFVKSRSGDEMNQHPAEPNLMKKSSSQHLSKLQDLVKEKDMPKQNEQQMIGGDGKHIKMKRKRDTDQYGGNPKKSKSNNAYHVNKRRSPNMDHGKASVNSRSDFPTKASGKDMRKYDDCLSEIAKDKLLETVKQGHGAQVLSDGRSLDVKNSIKKDGLVNKRRLEDWQDVKRHVETSSPNDGNSCGEEIIESALRKKKKCKVSKSEANKLITNYGDDKLNREGMMTQVLLSGCRNQEAVGMAEVRSVDKEQKSRKNRKQIASPLTLGGNPLRRDVSYRQSSLAATSCSSKISGSHKTRINFEDVKGSPVESVTSSPLRAPNLDKLTMARRDGSWKDGAVKGGLPMIGNFRRFSGREGNFDISQSVEGRKEKISSDFHPESRNFSAIEYQDGVANHKGSSKTKMSSEVRKGNILNGDAGALEQCDRSGNGTHLMDNCYHEDRVEKNHPENEDTSKRNSVGQWSSDSGMETALKDKNYENSVLEMSAPCSTNGRTSQQNLKLEFEDRHKADPVKTESRSVKSKVLSSSEGEDKKAKLSVVSPSATWCQKEDVSNGHPVHASGNGDVSKLTNCAAGISRGINHSSWNLTHDQLFGAQSPRRINASSQSPSITLLEAKGLREFADRIKSTGLGESNEAYFQAALKFLCGASLLESCSSDRGKREEMDPMQIYSSTAKLCASCAQEYERCQEMAAAALAYKCMEVAYMRIVYCKHPSTNRERHELQSTLQMVPQGESPSSSASDVDNLNNQAAVDKPALSKGTSSHFAGYQVVAARNCPKFLRVLDFTQDVICAMEASRKSQNAFQAANITMKEAQNCDHLASVKRVIDFSFQDVHELVRLVRLALDAISHSGLAGARD